MKHVSLEQAKISFIQLIEEVSEGEEIVISIEDQQVVRLTPVGIDEDDQKELTWRQISTEAELQPWDGGE